MFKGIYLASDKVIVEHYMQLSAHQTGCTQKGKLEGQFTDFTLL